MKYPAVYMLASQRNGTLYIGVTSDLIKRVWQHREGLTEGFTKQYGVKTLVWYEQHATMESAISREKAMKKWLRKWKLAAIEKTNPDWHDLWPEIIGAAPPAVVPANAGTQNSTALPLAGNYRHRSPAVVPANAGTHTPVVPANAGTHTPVVPANAGTQNSTALDSRIRGNDGEKGVL